MKTLAVLLIMTACGDNIAVQPDTCTDGELTAGESDVDCGGSCQGCAVGQSCGVGGDCLTGVCGLDSTCAAALCGDGVTNADEACDDEGESATCDDDCTDQECGDGTLNETAGEVCDDGNDVDDDACSNACALNNFLIDDFEGDTSSWTTLRTTFETNATTGSTAALLAVPMGMLSSAFIDRSVDIPSTAQAIWVDISGDVPTVASDSNYQVWSTTGGWLWEMAEPIDSTVIQYKFCIPPGMAGTTQDLDFVVRNQGPEQGPISIWVDNVWFTTDATGCVAGNSPI